MQARIEEELSILRKNYPGLEHRADGQWVRIPNYPLSQGWNPKRIDVVFQIPVGYPGTPPYGIYVPAGIRFQEGVPKNYSEPAGTQPPFGGIWGIFSWQTNGDWYPTAQIIAGSNLWSWTKGFAKRFREGL